MMELRRGQEKCFSELGVTNKKIELRLKKTESEENHTHVYILGGGTT